MQMMKVFPLSILCLLGFVLGCRQDVSSPPISYGREFLVSSNDSVQIVGIPIEAMWKIYKIKGEKGASMRQLQVDGKTTIREGDTNKDGVMDRIRIRTSSGHYLMIRDTNFDGSFDIIQGATNQNEDH